MGDTFVDFRIVKERVSIQAVLDHYGVGLRRANQNSLRGKCPLPTHSSKESKESFSVETTKNIWACQSDSCAAARQGKRGGNVLDFTAIMERCSIRDAAVKLQDWFISSAPARPAAEQVKKPTEKKLVSEKNQEVSTTTTGEVNKPLTFTLKDVDSAHPYVQSRGIAVETAKYFGVGFFPGKGSMSGRCVVPIHNEKKELVAYAGRAIDATEPKYKLPAGFQKSAMLYNLHRAVESGEKGLIVAEGFFDAMKIHQAGYPFVVALMGCTLSEAQEKLLIDHTRMVLLLLDGDDAGNAGASAIAARLVQKMFVKVIHLPDGKQPDQLSSDELASLLAV